jgi:hypothetical protein
MLTFVPDPAEVEIIQNSGFALTDQIKLLAVNIKADLNNINEIFEEVIRKIINLANFWERFKLSLPGRITNAKTYLVSQLNYIGCFLEIPAAILGRIQEIIDNFVRKNLNISEHRLSLSPDNGGLGMFNLSTFLKAQMCVWIGRAYRLPIDNWQYDLMAAAPLNNIALLRPMDVPLTTYPLLHNFARAFQDFYRNFSGCDQNYLEAYVFDNPLFLWGPDFLNTINVSSFGRRFYETHKGAIRSLKFSDCFNDVHFKDLNQFRDDGLPITPAVWM